MFITLELMYRSVPGRDGSDYLQVVANRTDIPLWWRRPKPWAKFEVVVPRPKSSAEGVRVAVEEMSRRLAIRDFGLDYEDELLMSGFGDIGTVTHFDQVYDDPHCTDEEAGKRYAA